jgi:hypothetical protein
MRLKIMSEKRSRSDKEKERSHKKRKCGVKIKWQHHFGRCGFDGIIISSGEHFRL